MICRIPGIPSSPYQMLAGMLLLPSCYQTRHLTFWLQQVSLKQTLHHRNWCTWVATHQPYYLLKHPLFLERQREGLFFMGLLVFKVDIHTSSLQLFAFEFIYLRVSYNFLALVANEMNLSYGYCHCNLQFFEMHFYWLLLEQIFLTVHFTKNSCYHLRINHIKSFLTTHLSDMNYLFIDYSLLKLNSIRINHIHLPTYCSHTRYYCCYSLPCHCPYRNLLL